MTKDRDAGWDHVFLKDPNDKTKGLVCKYCEKVTNGGITRAKEHIMGGFRTVTGCQRVPGGVRHQFKRAYEAKKNEKKLLERTQSRMTQFNEVVDREEKETECKEACEDRASGKRPISSSGQPLPARKVRHLGPIDLYYNNDLDEEELDVNSSGVESSNLVEDKDRMRDEAIQNLCRWMYDAGIPFHAVNYDSFQEMVEAIGEYGPNMEPPTYDEGKGICLEKEMELTKQLVKVVEEEQEKYGCSLMADSLRDGEGRSLINFLVNTSRGSMFVESVDTSSYSSKSNEMFDLLDTFVTRVGEKSVIQVITDCSSENVSAGKKLEARYPRMFWSPCASHSMELMFEDMFKLPELSRTLERAITISGYIRNRIELLNMVEEFTGQMDMLRTGSTRFVTAFLNFEIFHKHKSHLREMFVSSKWKESKFAKERDGKQIVLIIFNDHFWIMISYILKFVGPLLEVLRLVSGEKKPPMGYIYKAIECAKKKIVASFENKEGMYAEIFKIIDRRWEIQLRRPLHAAGCLLNPGFYYENKEIEDSEVITSGFTTCVEKLVEDEDIQDKIVVELFKYKSAEGSFSNSIAIRQRTTLEPVQWWTLHGSSAPNLKRLAIKILSLTCSSYGCERSWSVFQHIHSKKRNRREQKCLNDALYIKYNRALRRRYDKHDIIDPIVLENPCIDGTEEWLVGEMEEIALDDEDDDLINLEDNLTHREQADVASGASKSAYSLRNSKSKGSTPLSKSAPAKDKVYASCAFKSELSDDEIEKDPECYKDDDSDDWRLD